MPRAIRSSGDVFADLGFTAEESRTLRMKADLLAMILQAVRGRGLTQGSLAAILRAQQPRISDLMTGKISKFSLEALINYAGSLGLEVDLGVEGQAARDRVRPRPAAIETVARNLGGLVHDDSGAAQPFAALMARLGAATPPAQFVAQLADETGVGGRVGRSETTESRVAA